MLGQGHIPHLGPLAVHRFGQRLVSGPACSVLRALAGRVMRPYMTHQQWHAQLPAQGPAMAFKNIGGLLQAMVNVHGSDLPRPTPDTSEQQGGGVGSTAQCHCQRQARAEDSQRLIQLGRHASGPTR